MLQSLKINPSPLLLFAKMSALALLPSSLVRADTPKISKNPSFLHQKVHISASEEPPLPFCAKCSHRTNFPLTTDVLWTAPYFAGKWRVRMLLSTKQNTTRSQSGDDIDEMKGGRGQEKKFVIVLMHSIEHSFFAPNL